MFENILKVVLVLMIILTTYMFMPVMAFGFYGMPFMVLLIGLMIWWYVGFIKGDGDISPKENKALKLSYLIIGVGLAFFVIIPFLTTAPMFYSSDYRTLIGEVKKSDFNKDVAPIDLSEIRVVDEKLAAKLADKKLGDVPALGSIVTLGSFSIQQIKGELYWVAPLEHSGFFKWLNSDKGTPGYVMVSATNERDVKLVQQVNGKDIHLKYLSSAFFSENLERHIYLNGYMSQGFKDFSFELDDDLNPHYIVSIYDKTVGYSGVNITGVLDVNPQTGEITEYSVGKAPKWIDRIQPEDEIITQLNDWGQYVHGWLNSIFSQKDIMKITPGMSLVYGSDGKSYWYTGVSSVGKDESTIGFILVNTRTKKAYYYKQSGATETKAMASAEGMVQEKSYDSTFPILYNLTGVPTYVMTLKDREGLVKMIAMVSVENYSIVGVGKDLKSALRNYKASLKSKGNITALDSITDLIKVDSVITRFSTDIKDGNSYYYFQIKKYKNKIFVSTSQVSDVLPITKIGDRVRISFEENEVGVTDLSSFQNLEISFEMLNNK